VTRAIPDPTVVRRQNELFDHYADWSADHPGEDPDDDPEFVAIAREIMDLPPLDEDEDEDDEPELDQAARSAVLAVDFDDIAELERALGNQFKQYWLYGKGRAKWNTWTELYRRLIKHVGRLRAKRIASQWFHSRFGFWPGDDKNRVRQGKPPRGDRIGPG
jgi:hypothetical protein